MLIWAKVKVCLYTILFLANDMSDETFKHCFDDADLDPMNALAEVIPSAGHRVTFITAFLNKFTSNGTAYQVRLGIIRSCIKLR